MLKLVLTLFLFFIVIPWTICLYLRILVSVKSIQEIFELTQEDINKINSLWIENSSEKRKKS